VDPTCSRCSRRRREEEAVGLGIPIDALSDETRPDGRVLTEGAGWNHIAGELVCPQCVTVDEDHELAMSFISMVEAEVSRTQSVNGDAVPHHTPLIAYAMVLRERLRAAPPPPEWGPAGPSPGEPT
jgi:hypothetical protein